MTSLSQWDLLGLNLERFRAYTSLLSVRNGGQFNEREEAEYELSYTDRSGRSEDTDSIVAQAMTSFDDTRLQESFQNRVAELVFNLKGGYHVTATLLFHYAGKPELVIAKNEGFNTREKDFLVKLQALLRGVSNTSSKIT